MLSKKDPEGRSQKAKLYEQWLGLAILVLVCLIVLHCNSALKCHISFPLYLNKDNSLKVLLNPCFRKSMLY